MARRTLPDAHLFDLAMRDVVPLRKAPPKRFSPAVAAVVAKAPLFAAADAAPLFFTRPAPVPPPKSAPNPGLDRNTARRFERGELPIDRAIDLHGLTEMRAHQALDRFMADAVASGARMLLIVTGKGKDGDGVLRRHVPDWLRLGPCGGRILRQAQARLPHGGAGALYVLLRRNR
ncbi:MAG: Smr/MutS family protein [Magnetospirillum sp.]|nr:Smr/MutS family protein [Magnetospirillum sp.]